MQAPEMMDATQIDDRTFCLNSWLPVPGFGVLAVNSYLIKGEQPVLVDTGLAGLREGFMRELHKLIDPANLRWIWLTHADADHTGNLVEVLKAAPNARLVTTYLGMGKLGMMGVPLHRVYLVNPGQQLDVGDRYLLAVAPPTFDAPETTAMFDPVGRNLFSADSFGALLPEPVKQARDIPEDALRQGMLAWAAVDAPWLKMVDLAGYAAGIRRLRELDANRILSSHLPLADATLVEPLLEILASAPDAPPFVGPDQAALEQMMAAA